MLDFDNVIVKEADPHSKEFKNATLEVLVGDAIARKNKEALEWLKHESSVKVKRKRKGSDTEFEVNQTITKIRAEYAKRFLDYNPDKKKDNELARQRKKEEEEKARQDFFAKAFEQLKVKK